MKLSYRGFYLLLFIFFVVINCSNAQHPGYLDGFVVMPNGDSMIGKIEYKRWEMNPWKVKIKSNGSTNLYSPTEVLSFTVNGVITYDAWAIEKDMRPVDIHSLQRTNDKDTSIRDTSFLRVVTRGKQLTLYELLDNKLRYYIQEGSKEPEELIYKKYLNPSQTVLLEKPHFRNQLMRLAANNNNDKLLRKIEICRYQEYDLKKIIMMINGDEKKKKN